MVLRSLEPLDDKTRTRYEAVLVAAARARQINSEKIAAEERGDEEAARLKKIKVTSHALNELLDGKIDFERVED